jgi:hypothetical protein
VRTRLGQRSDEQVGGLVQGRLHRAGQLGQEHLAGLQVCQLAHLVGGQRPTVEDTALDDEGWVGPGEVTQALGGLHRVTGDERDGRRAGEVDVEGDAPRPWLRSR